MRLYSLYRPHHSYGLYRYGLYSYGLYSVMAYASYAPV